MDIKLSMFGAYRGLVPRGELLLPVPPDARIADVRAALIRVLKEQNDSFDVEGLVNVSVFADKAAVLKDDAALANRAELAVIPPISGG
jgi:molybdopterin converting factor small subunit